MDWEQEAISLDEWICLHPEEEDKRSVFLNLDRALKYIHEHGYYVESFHPSHIFILNEDDRYVFFKDLAPLSLSVFEEQIRANLFQSSVLQIGIHSGTLEHIQADFLKQNFDEFVQLLPEGDVPYYRGIIQRGSVVYYSDYILAKSNKDLKELAGQIDQEEGSVQSIPEVNNDIINDAIYQEYVKTSSGAFISLMFLPMLFVFLFVILFLVFGGWAFLL